MKLVRIVVAIMIAIFPGCARYYSWTVKHFTQADKLASCSGRISDFIRSGSRYDGFQTVGFFDILWLSDEVMNAYVDLIAQRCGLSAVKKENLRLEKLADGKHSIVFYLSMTEELGRQVQIATCNMQPHWTVVLTSHDKEYAVASVTRIDLDPEFKEFFIKGYNRYHTAWQLEYDWSRYRSTYRLVFDRFDDEGTDLLDGTIQIDLRSPEYGVKFCWNVDRLLETEDQRSCEGFNEINKHCCRD